MRETTTSATLVLGDTPRFPAASKKRGMARAVEIVEWMRDYARERCAESEATGRHQMAASCWKQNADSYDHVVKMLKKER